MKVSMQMGSFGEASVTTQENSYSLFNVDTLNALVEFVNEETTQQMICCKTVGSVTLKFRDCICTIKVHVNPDFVGTFEDGNRAYQLYEKQTGSTASVTSVTWDI